MATSVEHHGWEWALRRLFMIERRVILPISGETTGIVTAAHWLSDDIQANADVLVNLVDRLSRLCEGSADEVFVYAGNAWLVHVGPAGVEMQNRWIDSPASSVSNGEMLEVVAQFWQCMVGKSRGSQFRKASERFANINGHLPKIPWDLDAPIVGFDGQC